VSANGRSGSSLAELSRRAGEALRDQGLLLVTAESCTGGGVSWAVTMVPGSSHWFDRGFVTYTNDAKQRVLGVAPSLLREFGAVSEPVARSMALGAMGHSQAQVALAVTGIAGPDGGTPDKPVGMVCFAWAIRRVPDPAPAVRTATYRFAGDRHEVREAAVAAALEGVISLLERPGGSG